MVGWLTQEGKNPVNPRLSMLRWKSVWIPAVIGLSCWVPLSHADDAGQKAVAETRQALRKEGFKTDLADFDLSTTPELRARETILMEAVVEPTPTMTNGGLSGPSRHVSRQAFLPTVNSWDVNPPDLMETMESNSAAVVWKLASPERPLLPRPRARPLYSWDDFRKAIDAKGLRLDRASAVIFSGPIRFDLSRHASRSYWFPHLDQVKSLERLFDNRLVLALHDGNLAAAWTNLLAATRLVTAWEPGPPQSCHLARFETTDLAFIATWQALQTNGWSDAQLARLQAEWESVDFFTRLPDTAAYQRARNAAWFRRERLKPKPDVPFGEFMAWALRFPVIVWEELNEIWWHEQYLQHASYIDEIAVLLHYRDAELELRRAVQAPTWSDMGQIPGVLRQSLLRPLPFRSQGMDNKDLLGYASVAEAQRRILIAAIALERYRGKHGSYPNTLSELAPEFLKNPPADFMDGQPLRYRFTADGHFLLYSIGLGCVDRGGQMPSRKRLRMSYFESGSFGAPTKGDIVWPFPASTAAMEAIRAEEAEAQAEMERASREGRGHEEMADAAQWDHTARHQADIEKLLAAPASPNPPDLNYHGRRISEVLRNRATSGTNQPTLSQMLTLKQIITGAEPETVTFEMPVSYDVATKLGRLFLFIDPANNDDSDEGCNVQQMECDRAHNGDCLLVWNTIFESFGKHALQAGLLVNELPPNNSRDISGPLLPFTITNLCQFSLTSAHFDPRTGATLHAKLPERNGNYTIELNTTNGALIKTLTGSTSNGVIKVHWDLIDGHGRRFTNDFFNSVFHITLPDSGRSQTLKGP
jgi:hypothetical protein